MDQRDKRDNAELAEKRDQWDLVESLATPELVVPLVNVDLLDFKERRERLDLMVARVGVAGADPRVTWVLVEAVAKSETKERLDLWDHQE